MCGCPVHGVTHLLYQITFDQRSPKINGAPTLLMSGAVHYTRVHEQEWGRVLSKWD